MSSLLASSISNTDRVQVIFRVKSKVNLVHLRPHLMVEGVLSDGEVTVDVMEDLKVLSSTSIDYTKINEIKQSSESARGYFRFDTNVVLNHNSENVYTEYKVVIYMKNHTESSVNKISVLSDFNQSVELHNTDSEYGYNIEFYTV